MKGKLIIFSAPSGAGKTTIVKQVMCSGLPLEFSVSATSRLPRNNERHGVDYFFLSADEFKKRINNQEFIEWEEVYKNQFYGTLKSEVERIRNKGFHVVFDVDVVGGLNLKNIFKHEAFAIFIQPPSYEVLKMRLINRGSESEESLNKRLEKAEYELSFAPKFDVVIVNDVLNVAVNQVIMGINDFVANSL